MAVSASRLHGLPLFSVLVIVAHSSALLQLDFVLIDPQGDLLFLHA